tara:strand:+ start:10821 stop:12404 length:1584 start_codon:yes stop_codon:yes gene_type:complete
MKSLIRSTIVVDATKDLPVATYENCLKFEEANISCDVPEEQKIWDFVRDFARNHGHAPNIQTVREFFIGNRDDDTVNRLEFLIGVTPLYRGDFQSHALKIAESRSRLGLINLCKQVAQIADSGMVIKDGKKEKTLMGSTDAIRYMMDKSHDYVSPVFGARLSGEVTTDGEAVVAEYDRVKNDPHAGIGAMVGIKQMDEMLQGAQKAELWTHAAYTGGLKSTLMLNWAYNQSVMYGSNSLIFSLEMPYDQCRRILYAMHSMSPALKDKRVEYGIQEEGGPVKGLHYAFIKQGKLSPHEEPYFKDCVVPHFASGPTVTLPSGEPIPHGRINIEVADPDKSDFTVADIRAKAELLYAENPFSVIFVDHAGLISPRYRKQSTTENTNEVMRDLKKLAMSFNRGQGIAVVALFQVNRQGFKEACKRKEKGLPPTYTAADLAYANEAEKSSDVVTAAFIDSEYRNQGRVFFHCLKTRDNAPFEPFFSRVEWPCRRILHCDEIPEFGDGEREKVAQQAEDISQQQDVIDKMLDL